MPTPTEFDVDKYGRTGFEMMERYGDDTGWCYASLEDVQAAFWIHNFDFEIHFVQGDVIETLERIKPETISVLRQIPIGMNPQPLSFSCSTLGSRQGAF